MDNVEINDQLILVCGKSGTGKSASLRNIQNQEKWLYFNTEAGKRLPFKNKFKNVRITNPMDVLSFFDEAIANPDKVDGIIIDSLTFLMEQYESQFVVNPQIQNTMKGWSNYNQYFKQLMQDKIVKFNKPTIIIAHTQDFVDERTMDIKTSVPIKGALKGSGVEAYFSTIVAAKKVPIKVLEQYNSPLLTITDEDRDLGYKHVFQTRITKDTLGERIRSPMGLFDKSMTYMDNDCQLLLKHLTEFYND